MMEQPSHPADPLLGNVRQTLATALKVLDHLEQSLRQAGFAEGRDAYRKMADTVLGQSLWLAAKEGEAPEELNLIADRARAIHALLTPYTEAMLRLGALTGTQTASKPRPDPEDPIIKILARARRPVSFTALRAELGADRKQLLARLGELVQAGTIIRHSGGGRESYSLEPPA